MREETYLGKENLDILQNKKIAIIGVGAIGSSHALLLTKLGIKNLIVVDRDIVQKENLSTQVLYTKKDLNKPKVEVCKEALKKINKDINITKVFDHLDFKNINKILKDSDLILDGTDNLSTRFLIDEYCKKNNKVWIFCSVIKEQGFCMVLNKDYSLNSFLNKDANPKTCSELGVLIPSISFASSFAVTQAIKILLNKEFDKELFYFDLEKNIVKKLKIPKSTLTSFDYLEGKNTPKVRTLCGKNEFLIYKRKKSSDIKHTKDLTDFGDKVIIRAKDLNQAKSKYNQLIGEF